MGYEGWVLAFATGTTTGPDSAKSLHERNKIATSSREKVHISRTINSDLRPKILSPHTTFVTAQTAHQVRGDMRGLMVDFVQISRT
jgi:hypothetical protein